MTVIDFYLARLDDIEARFEHVVDAEVMYAAEGTHAVNHDEVRTFLLEPGRDWARKLADCQAKRRIVAMYLSEAAQTGPAVGNQEAHIARLGALADVIQTLAATYADHEDWNPDWSVSE